MVSLKDVHASNSRIASTLPGGLVAVFAGASNGIGEFTLKQFAKHAHQPRVYFAGRSQMDGERVAAECKALNPQGEFVFIQADLSLVKNVDEVCKDIISKEITINLLFMSIGTLVSHTETSEGLHLLVALPYYCRTRFILNLLPLIRRAKDLRRVVHVGAGTKEGKLDTTDWQARKIPFLSVRGHLVTMTTLSLEAIARSAPDVSFIHAFPGPVKTTLGKDLKGFWWSIFKGILAVLPMPYVPQQESGERHLFLSTSARYAPGEGEAEIAGVPLEPEAAVARGTDGIEGSGIYSVDWDGESASPKVEQLLAKYRESDMVDIVWDHSMGEFKRITGVESIS